MALLDLLGRRWSLRLLWELRHGSLGFRALRAACGGMSQSMLTVRLRELRAAGLVDTDEHGAYRRTPLGDELGDEMLRLDRFAGRWATQLRTASGQRQCHAETTERAVDES
ncbi:MAG: winged helix-turn-helix transcriptional regulator [Dermatophilaceae bacterium]